MQGTESRQEPSQYFERHVEREFLDDNVDQERLAQMFLTKPS